MDLKIFQIYYNEKSSQNLDSTFIPYDNSNGYAKWFEYGVFRENFLNNNYKSSEYTGFLSWKFKDKTRIDSQRFISFIEQNEGNDVYFLNPFQSLTNRFRNVWESGEYFHPGLKEIANYIFRRLNYNIDIDKIVNTHSDTLYCNYWVANEKFWTLFMNFTDPIYSYIEFSKDPYINEKVLRRADASIDASFIPFLMERMFSTILFYNHGIIKSKPLILKPWNAYSLSLYPIYLKLDKLKKNELDGKEIEVERSKLLPFLDDYTLMAESEKNKGIVQKILNRILFFFKCAYIFLHLSENRKTSSV